MLNKIGTCRTFKTFNNIQIKVILFSLYLLFQPALLASGAMNQSNAKPCDPINYRLLNLTSEQNRKLNDIWHSQPYFSRRLIRLKADIQIRHLEIQKERMQATPNKARIHQLTKQKQALAAELQNSSLESYRQFLKILTPAQIMLLEQHSHLCKK